MNNKGRNLVIIISIALVSILIRLLFIYTIPYDSDEITWSIIGRRVLSGEDFHIFFLNQKYMGAIEGYIVGIFQAIFGYNLITLRINSLLFSTITSIAIFLILKKIVGTRYALLGPIIFNLASYDVTSNYTKAWGNRPLVSLIGLLVVYACWYLFLSEEKIKEDKRIWLSSLTGVFLGLSFWANLENVYFIVIAFIISILGMLSNRSGKSIKGIKKEISLRLHNSKKINIDKIISFIFYALIFWLFYMLATKKALFNPYETLSVKLGLEDQNLQFLNYSFETQFFLLLFYIIAPIKLLLYPSKDKKVKSFSLIFALFMLGAYFTISRNSIERTNQIEETFQEQYDFLTGAILPLFFGTNLKSLAFALMMTFPGIILVRAIYKVFKDTLKNGKLRIDLENIFCFYYLIPILFFLSKAGGINGSSRYITNMWPGFVILFVLGFYTLFKNKNIILKICAVSILIFFINRNYVIYKAAANNLKQKEYANTDYIRAAKYLVDRGIKGCYAGYWNAYPIMFESDYKVICSPSPYFGYGENETPFNTIIVDSFDNPAFVFTTQKRVDEFFRKWACPITEANCDNKEIEIIEKTNIGRYFIFLSQRLE